MLQFLRGIGQLFSDQRNPEKCVPYMSKPHFPIYHIVQESPAHSPPDALLSIFARAEEDPRRDQTLRDCTVDDVAHYRELTGGKGAHEFVIARFHHDSTDGNGVVHRDCRAAKFERLKKVYQEDDYTGCTPRSATPLVNITREQLDKTTTETLDRVSFIENPRDWLSRHRKYELVASFTPAPGILNIVDCAVAAHVLTQRAVHYTTLQFMCMWYARMLFETLSRLAGSPPAVPGPALRTAGKFGKLRLVRPDGRLKVREQARTRDEAANQVVALLHLCVADMDDESAEAMLSAFLHEFEDAQGSTTIEPLREVEAQVRTLRDQQWEVIRKAARCEYDRRHTFEHAKQMQHEVRGFRD
ncbi:hypothetical protein FB107DRAFT_203534 [Schizophyllum commune]